MLTTDALEEVTGALAATEIANVAGGEARTGIRTHALNLRGIARWAVRLSWYTSLHPLKASNEDCASGRHIGVLSALAYVMNYPSRQRRYSMDVDLMVERWKRTVIGLCCSHTKDELDCHEFQMEEWLAPLLTAPVKQIREFARRLVEELEADPRVPFFVHVAFRGYWEVLFKTAPDEDFMYLKTSLAKEIAELVEKDVQPDIKAAIAGALQWRSPEMLGKIKDAVKAGAKPRLKGKESCMFLCVDDATGKEQTVML